jgi:GNAT superfamily N-acetyltransferase
MTVETEVLKSPIIEVAGTAFLHGANAMREPHWRWNWPAQRAHLLKTPGGENASILRLFVRVLARPERKFRAVGIGGVWTRPDLRRQGYATMLLRESIVKIAVDQPSCDVLVLYSEPRRLYLNEGFFEILPGLQARPLHHDVTLLPNPAWSLEPEGRF